MTLEERVEFLHQSIESHDQQIGELTQQIGEMRRGISDLGVEVHSIGQEMRAGAAATKLSIDRLALAMNGLTDHVDKAEKRLDRLEQ